MKAAPSRSTETADLLNCKVYFTQLFHDPLFLTQVGKQTSLEIKIIHSYFDLFLHFPIKPSCERPIKGDRASFTFPMPPVFYVRLAISEDGIMFYLVLKSCILEAELVTMDTSYVLCGKKIHILYLGNPPPSLLFFPSTSPFEVPLALGTKTKYFKRWLMFKGRESGISKQRKVAQSANKSTFCSSLSQQEAARSQSLTHPVVTQRSLPHPTL